MAITRLWQTGWELGQLSLSSMPAVEITSIDSLHNTTGETAKTGTYALGFGSGGSTTYQQIDAPISQCRFAAHLKHDTATAATYDLFQLRSNATFIIRVQYSIATGSWIVLHGATIAATVLDTAFLPRNVYSHIGVDVKIDGAAGWVYVYRNGVQIVGYDGDTNDGGSTFNRLYLGNNGSGSMGSNAAIDDVYWDDTTGEPAPTGVPDRRFPALTPDGTGHYAQWTGNDLDNTDNYLLVDERPHNSDTDYVFEGVSGKKDSYTMTDYTIPGGFTVRAVIPLAVARKADAAGGSSLKMGTRYDSTDNIGGANSLPSSYGVVRGDRQTTDPSVEAWDQTSINGVEAVVEVA
jgi:hypothetical protein